MAARSSSSPRAVALLVPFFALAAAAPLAPALAAGPGATASSFWSDVSASSIAPAGERLILPLAYRTVALEREALAAFLALVPLEGTPAAAGGATLELPLPAGGFGRFAVVESPIMAPELQKRYPEIRTYAGHGLDDPSATLRFDLTPHGFHAIILSAHGTVYIDPYQRGDVAHYQSYFKRDFVASKGLGGCTLLDEDGMAEEIARMIAEEPGKLRAGAERRTYRTAVAATGEYTIFHGGTVPLGLAAVVTSMNRVAGVYEREVAVRMELVADNDLIIYTDPATDPYTNNNGGTMLGQNQTNLDAVIGSANYDLGHVFSTGGGGIANLGVVCRAGLKARGVTGSPQPIGDAYDIDYVAHEIGHQFGSNHCFNGDAGACGGNRYGPSAYEPGSGSTIMAYAGICGGHNLQPHSDDYFLWKSLDEINAYLRGPYGNSCPVITPTGVIEPAVEAGAGGFTIPLRTPFRLTATAATTGTATYCWEESDLGPAGHPNSPSGNAPLFRSFEPVESPSRTFPKISDIVNNTQTIGEILPTYARNLSFQCTVRDVQTGGVGVARDGIAFAVASIGPFLVTSPNTAVTWQAGIPQTVVWDVAGTDVPPVNCAIVDILLSTDGGYSFPTVLAAGTPNDGSEEVVLPAVATATARIKVEAADNIFFDLSNQNFTIELADPNAVAAPATGAALALRPNQPNPAREATTIRYLLPERSSVSLRIYDPSGRLVRTIQEGVVEAGSREATWDGSDAEGRPVSSGTYFYRLRALDRSLTGRATILR